MKFKKKRKQAKYLILLLIVIPIYIGIYAYFNWQPCISSGDGSDIQDALIRKGSKAKLCQKSVFFLSDTINFTHSDQELFTEGLPTDSSKKAHLKIVNKNVSLAVNAFNQNNVKIKNIKVDGNRRELGQLVSHALIIVGGNVLYQQVDSVEAYDSRSWSTIHVNWGNFYDDENGNKHTSCKNVHVTNNIVGPSGETTTGKWSDGISVQCEESLVEDNTIVDVTDGGIVIFGAPKSKIINNHIYAEKQPLLVGIALVDYNDYKGNYKNVQVINNKIISDGSYIRAGIAMGSKIWHCPSDDDISSNFGAVIKNNKLSGDYFGYGYVINGVNDWVVEENISEAKYEGIPGTGCGVPNTSLDAFLFEKNNSFGIFQSEFRDARLEKIHDILPE